MLYSVTDVYALYNEQTTFLIHKTQWTNINWSIKITSRMNNSYELRIRTSAYIGSLQMSCPCIHKFLKFRHTQDLILMTQLHT
jgi:hypothetical protein